MSANFDYAVAKTLSDEGVWSDHPQDTGGKTKYGITEGLAAGYGVVVENITVDKAIYIYHAEFWEKLHLDAVRSKWVAAEVFDTAVNMGRVQAALCAQRACNLLLAGDPLVVDGVFGEKTRAGLNELSRVYHKQLLAALNGYQFVTYTDIHKRNPVMAEAFIRGWLRRLQIPGDAPERA
jgi:lysozyme family protein